MSSCLQKTTERDYFPNDRKKKRKLNYVTFTALFKAKSFEQ